MKNQWGFSTVLQGKITRICAKRGNDSLITLFCLSTLQKMPISQLWNLLLSSAQPQVTPSLLRSYSFLKSPGSGLFLTGLPGITNKGIISLYVVYSVCLPMVATVAEAQVPGEGSPPQHHRDVRVTRSYHRSIPHLQIFIFLRKLSFIYFIQRAWPFVPNFALRKHYSRTD